MAITTRQLIDDAYHLSSIVSNEFQKVKPSQETEGLRRLNQLLDAKKSTINKILYYSDFDFIISPTGGVIGDGEEYFIPGLVFPSTLTFVLDTVRYSIRPWQRKLYQGGGRANNIQTLPGICLFERSPNGTSLFIYPIPNQDYPATIWGKFSLGPVTIDQELTFEDFYTRYLTYELGSELCNFFNISFPENARAILLKIEQEISNLSPPDMTIVKISTLGRKTGGINYGDVNIGRGWVP